MRILSDALVIIDLQKGVCHSPTPIYQLDTLIPKLNERIDDYCQRSKPIIFIQHIDDQLVENSKAFALLPEIHQPVGSIYVYKTHANGFYHTSLDSVLQKNHCESLEIWGAQTEYCIDATTKFAHGLGYTVRMISGNTTTYDTLYMNAEQTIEFYEKIWANRFVTMLD